MTSPDQPAGVDRGIGEDLARRLVDLYADTERRLAADIARRLAAGQDTPDWAERKLSALQQLLRWARTLLQRVERDTELEVTQALLLGYMRGGTEAMRTITRLQNTLPEWLDLAGVVNPNPRILEALRGRRTELERRLDQLTREFPGLAALQQIVRSLTLRINGTHLPVLRWVEDAYREVIATSALPDVTLGLKTRRRASQVAWERLLGEGITGFTDKRGRRWNLATYVEMATRTGVAQAAVEGHLDRLADAGIDLVIVSNAPQECALCRPWEGKILARAGVSGPRRVTVQNAVTGNDNTITIAGTVTEAIAAGLMHPNCRHSLSAYVHGATRVPSHTADPEGDEARQHLRFLERKVRKAKLKAAAAIDPAAAKDHKAKVRDLQRQIREHVAATAHLGIKRKPEREQIDLGNRVPQTRTEPAPEPPAVPKAAQPFHRNLDGIEDLAAAVSAVTADTPRTKLAGGHSGSTESVQLPDGRRLVTKRGEDWGDPQEVAESTRTQADAEQLASLVGRAIGAPVVRVYRQDPDRVWMDWADGTMIGDLPDSDAQTLIESRDGQLIGLLDMLIGNADRNGGNILVAEGRMVGIDHGWAWQGLFSGPIPGLPGYPASNFADEFALVDNPLTLRDVTVLRTRLEGLRLDFEHVGRGDWLDAALRRLAELARHARGAVDLVG